MFLVLLLVILQVTPQLQVTQQKNSVAATKDKVKPVRKFKPGDSVLVYNTLTKLNSNGVVKDIKSNNSYIVFVNDRDKHISGDHMSLISNNNNVKDKQVLIDDNLHDSDEDLDISDNISVDYDSDDDLELISQTVNNVNNINNVHRRHYRTEAQKLQDNLSNIHPESRLRSGNNV